MPRDAIAAEDLMYNYGNLVAVNNISFTVEEKKIMGFLGPNGAGKTTTFKMLTGQMKPK
ncbi:MAG: ATP-binding cassette domain-containing protein, partial [Dehalococcoidales bacterium]|nr:ATP-binding cassette domain-containing protein [Dehalococcoidales bacterium]